jgi:hypothetical protein
LTRQLDVADATGQVVLNGQFATFAAHGRSMSRLEVIGGENRVEAVLAAAAGRPGTWRFDLSGVEAGSLKAMGGEVVLASSNAIVFRLRGRVGERVGFSFRRDTNQAGSSNENR